MLPNFQLWFETIRVRDAEKIGQVQKQREKKSRQFRRLREFKPGTFGVEIEFHPEERQLDYEATVDALKKSDVVEKEFDKLATKYGWKPIDPGEWFDENPRPDEPEEDYDADDDDAHDAYRALYKKWENEVEEWDREYQDLQMDWEEWEEHTQEEKLKTFIDNIINNDEYHHYDVKPKYENRGDDPAFERLNDIVDDFESLGLAHGVINGQEESSWTYENWIIHVDDTNLEVTSPILTLDDLDELMEVLDHLKYEEFSGATSAHVHIGLPEDTDAFDLLALTTMPDENAISIANPGRDTHFTKPSADMHYNIYNNFESGEYDPNVFQMKLRGSMSGQKHWGVNIYSDLNSSNRKTGRTVEFRYLSSEIVSKPEKFIDFIKYYLKLPHVARGRNQIKLDVHVYEDQHGTIYFTRLPNGMIRVDKDPLTKVPRSGRSPDELRALRAKTPIESRMDDVIWRKIRETGVWELPEKWGYPVETLYHPIRIYLQWKLGGVLPNEDLMALAQHHNVKIKNIEGHVIAGGLDGGDTMKDRLFPYLVGQYRRTMNRYRPSM